MYTMHGENAAEQVRPLSQFILHRRRRANERRKTFLHESCQEAGNICAAAVTAATTIATRGKHVLARVVLKERSVSTRHLPQPLCTTGAFQRSSPQHGIGWARCNDCRFLQANGHKIARFNFLSTRGTIRQLLSNSLSSW